jgi:MFS family permease
VQQRRAFDTDATHTRDRRQTDVGQGRLIRVRFRIVIGGRMLMHLTAMMMIRLVVGILVEVDKRRRRRSDWERHTQDPHKEGGTPGSHGELIVVHLGEAVKPGSAGLCRAEPGRAEQSRALRYAPTTEADRVSTTNNPRASWRRLPPAIWALGFASLFMDASSELIHSLLPVLLVTTLGASMTTVGLIEGVAEATAAITKVFSGALSDYLGKRKALVVLGYALGALTKPVFPLASSVGWVFAARFVDRVGKGIRGAPRDALVADLTPAPLRGAAYGLRQSLDSVGAVLGPALAVVLMVWLAGDIRMVMAVAVVPAVITVILLVVYVREPDRAPAPAVRKMRFTVANAGRLPSQYWLVVSLGGVFTLARFSEAFLVLRALDAGLALTYVPLVMIVMNVVYAVAAYPAGAAADRMRPASLLLAGLLLLVAADVVLAVAASPIVVFAGVSLWGLHMGLTQGLLSKLVADHAPSDLVATAFGIFNLVTGGALLLASVVAGALWSTFGPSATFLTGAGLAGVAALGVARLSPASPGIEE